MQTKPKHVPVRRSIGSFLVMAIMVFTYAPSPTTAQTFEWARSGGGYGWKQGRAIAMDANGNSIVAGEFTGNNGIAFDDAFPVVLPTTLSAAESTDAYIAMYDAAGTLKWATSVGMPQGVMTATSVAVAHNTTSGQDILYITGEIGSTSLTPIVSGSTYVAKYTYDNQGVIPQWRAVAGPTSQPLAAPYNAVHTSGIALDAAGNPYICGSVLGTATIGATTASSSLGRMFVAKLVDNGTTGGFDWVKFGATTNGGASTATAIAIRNVSGADRVYVTGNFTGNVQLPGSITLGGSPTGQSMFLARCAALDGIFDAATQAAGVTTPAGTADSRCLAVDNSGNAYVAGSLSGTINFSGSPYTARNRDLFVARYNNIIGALSPTPQWVLQGTTGLAGDAACNGIAVSNGTVYATGTFSGTMSVGSSAVVAVGNHDAFVLAISPAGAPQWSQRAGNPYSLPAPASNPSNHYDQGTAVAAVGAFDPVILGEYGGVATFFDIHDLSFQHPRNVFVARIAPTSRRVTGTLTTTGGAPVANRAVEIMDGVGSIQHAMSDAGGAYAASLRSGGTYTPRVVDDLAHWDWTPDPANLLAGPAPVQNFTAHAVADGITDLRISITVQSTEHAVIDKEVRYLIKYENVGTQTSPPSTITLCYNPHILMNAPASDPTLPITSPTSSCQPSTQSSLAWKVPALDALTGGVIVVTGRLLRETPTNPQDTLTGPIETSATIEDNTQSESSPLRGDNRSKVDQEVVQPLDPNDKTVAPLGTIGVAGVRARQTMSYTINFFNEGPGIAKDVVITDVLDTAFDPATVVLQSGGPGAVTLAMNGAIATFTLTNAMLQARSQSIPGSQGFVTFTVELREGAAAVPVGVAVPNEARIVFMDMLGNAMSPVYTPQAENCVNADFTAIHTCFRDITDFSTMGEDGISYLPAWAQQSSIGWDFGDGTTQHGVVATHQYSAPGTYIVTMTARDSLGIRRWLCDQYIDSFLTIRKMVIITPRPDPVVTWANGSLVTTTGAGYQTYQWYLNATPIPGATGASYTPPTPFGAYYVCASNGAGCTTCSDVKVLGVPVERIDRRLVSVSPNPGTGAFSIGIDRTAPSGWNVTIVDMFGETVLERAVAPGVSACAIDLAGKPSGVYTAIIRLDGAIATRTFVLSR